MLITGETGTGKELFAHAVHSLSRRKNGPFIPVDCSALPEHLAESELFGHCRGAFTDAHSDRKGLAAMAEGGTLFLDEIDSLSATTQAKLLRFLQEGTYRALGTDRFVRANVRVLAASNRNMEECVREGKFRSDLYFRVNILRLQLPSLRERRADIPLLANYFLEHHNLGSGQPRKIFSPAALRNLQSYSWPGNVRELFNTVERAAVCCTGRLIAPAHISFAYPSVQSTNVAVDGNFRHAKQCMIERFEQNYIEELLAKHGGNITHAAQEACKDRRAFGKLAKKYGIIYSRPA
ncbi:MAG TPA: sigma-54 dependent transcriptional regulator [Terriglobales bacterium]|nr:sigma-54 dependent transcriptional regulator [Terriglobales bacterium]